MKSNHSLSQDLGLKSNSYRDTTRRVQYFSAFQNVNARERSIHMEWLLLHVLTSDRPGGTAPVAPALAGPIFSSKAGIVHGSVGHGGRSSPGGTIRRDATKLRKSGWGMITRARLTNLK